MTTDLSVFHLVAEASLLVQLVMAILALASVLSWALIYHKSRVLKQARIESENFEDRFWSGLDVSMLYRELQPKREQLQGLDKIFTAGFTEFARLHKQTGSQDRVLEGAHRSMRIALARETEHIESHLPFLATVGSISPYIGLFGTVWGIMNSFRELGNVQQATLASVAPGIAEALIATAMGLFAAIPAVIAYNRFSTDVDRLVGRYETFMEEFASLLQRSALNQATK